MKIMNQRLCQVMATILVLAPASAASATETIRYVYDARGALTHSYRESGPAAGFRADYSYDRADNRSNVNVQNVIRYLQAGEEMYSQDGRFRLIMQTDGNFVLYQGYAALWHTSTSGSGANNLAAFQADGNLVVYNPNQPVWSSGIYSPGATLALQNDGNLVIYAINGQPLWASGTGGR